MAPRCNVADLRGTCYVPLCFSLWYALNVAYNITNKWALEEVRVVVEQRIHSHHASSALPFTIGCLQFGIGAVYACTLWMLGWRRPAPHADELAKAASYIRKKSHRLPARLFGQSSSQHHYEQTGTAPHTGKEHTTQTHASHSIRQTFNIAIHHTFGQLCTVMSLSSGSVSFAHVVKAMEPFFSALASRLALGQTMDLRVYLSLIPVVGGVIMACAGSPEFSWVSFWSGMGSNAFFAMRAVTSKIAMEGSPNQHDASKQSAHDNNEMNDEESDFVEDSEKDHGHAPVMSPTNLFGAVTCVSFVLSIPLALFFEGSVWIELLGWNSSSKADIDRATIQSQSDGTILKHIVLSGLFHYLNNEVMYLALSQVHPITLAVGNTAKRVVIIVAGVIVFQTPVTAQTAIGSAIGIGGVLVYSMMKQWYGTKCGDDESNTDSGAYCAKVQ
ncbi:hypothetical protein ACHAXT_004410 [Thalassiosira profunda]